jgi:hypothetical protein
VLRISGRMAFMNAAVLRDTLISFVDKDDLPYQDIVFDCAGTFKLTIKQQVNAIELPHKFRLLVLGM